MDFVMAIALWCSDISKKDCRERLWKCIDQETYKSKNGIPGKSNCMIKVPHPPGSSYPHHWEEKPGCLEPHDYVSCFRKMK